MVPEKGGLKSMSGRKKGFKIDFFFLKILKKKGGLKSIFFAGTLKKGGLKSRFFSSALKKGGLYRGAYPSPSHNEYPPWARGTHGLCLFCFLVLSSRDALVLTS